MKSIGGSSDQKGAHEYLQQCNCTRLAPPIPQPLVLATAFASKRRKQGVSTAGTPDASANAKLVSHLAEVLLQSAVLVGQA